MPFITQGCRTYVYAIRLQTGRIRDRINDPYIFIGMSCKRRIHEFLEYFTNETGVNDSFNHQTVRARLLSDPNETFYVTLITRFSYDPLFSRAEVVNLQEKYNVEIPYP